MKKVELSIYEGDLQIITRAASLWGQTVEDWIYDAALGRAKQLLEKRKVAREVQNETTR